MAVTVPLALAADSSRENGSGTCSLADTKEDPVCIVGMSCRLPGQLYSPSDLWKFLLEKKTAMTPVHPQRFNVKGFHHLKGANLAGAIDIEGGYFIQEDIREFENGFFGINNLEATYMDPQQRKLLEVVYECFEAAGVTMDQMSGSSTGVYVANFTSDFQVMQAKDPDYYHRYHPTGSGLAIMSNRVSHAFNLQGPSMTIDTACSSSIYALHQAITAITVGDCDQAIVAGANLIQSPEQHIGTAKGGFLSPTSTCHTFDMSADGYGRGEAVNAILIKRLSSAMEDGDKICAIIRSSAINANGKTPGITLPDAALQAEVIRKAYQKAGLDPADTDYVECHGTGTPVGDPIEVDALSRCFSPRNGPPLLIGSVKTNLGHSEAASGLTSIIKVACAFEYGAIPPTRGVVNVNPKLKLEERTMKIATEAEAWPRDLRRASVNSFGYGGANGHVILESPESYLGKAVSSKLRGTQKNYEQDRLLVLPVSAASSQALETRVQQVTDMVTESDASVARNIAFTLGQRRSPLRAKRFLLAKTHPGKTTQLELLDPQEQVATTAPTAHPFAFVFTGQGAQYAGMGKELLQTEKIFRATIHELDTVLKALPAEYVPTWTLQQAILDPPEKSQVNKVTHSQPLCTAIQIGLVRLLRSWGIVPAAVVGHSSGEIAAAYSAGLLNASQAIVAAYFRGYAAGQLQTQGVMMAASLSQAAAQGLITDKGLESQVRVACVNAPESVTLSGSVAGIDRIQAELQQQGKFNRKLDTGGRAYHSHMMSEIGSMYQDLLVPHFQHQGGENGDDTKQPRVTMYSSVGVDAADLRVMNSSVNMASYWRENLEQPVQFSAALSSLINTEGKHHLIEIGPHPALQGPIKAIRTAHKLDQNSLPSSSTLARKSDASLSLAKLAGTLFVHGHVLDWAKVNPPPAAFKFEPVQTLPPYPWDYSAGLLWNEPRTSIDLRNRRYLRHELLGVLNPASSKVDWSWRNMLRLSDMPWMRDHKVGSQIVFPGAGYMAAAIEAVCQASGLRDKHPGTSVPAIFEFRNVNISAALVLQEADNKTELHTSMSLRKLSTATASADWYDFSISSWVDGQATKHCTGTLRAIEKFGPLSETEASVPAIDEEGYDVWAMGRWYERCAEEGLNFGHQFQSLTSMRTDGLRVNTDAVSTTLLQPPAARDGMSLYPMHPITIDACFQASIMGGTAGILRDLRAWLPVFVSECRIDGSISANGDKDQEPAEIHTRVFNTGVASRSIDCTVRRPGIEGIAIDMKNVRLALYTGKSAEAQVDQDNIYLQRHPCLRVHWKPDVTRLHAGGESELRDYLSAFVAQLDQRYHADLVEDESLAIMSALLTLVGHKNPQMRVLELGASCDCKGKQLLTLLGKNTAFPQCRAWHGGTLDESGELFLEADIDMFDTVLIPQLSTASATWEQRPERITSLLSDDGVIVTRKTDTAVAALEAADFTVLDVGSKILFAVRQPKPPTALKNRKAMIVVKTPSADVKELASSVRKYLQNEVGMSQVEVIPFDHLSSAATTADTICISLLEAESEFLATMSSKDMDCLRLVTDVVTDLVWLTGADMLGISPDPNLTLSSGLSRALMLEQPSLRFVVLDMGAVGQQLSVRGTCENIERVLFSSASNRDAEFIQRGSLLYVSRFGPDWDINALFRRRLVAGDETIHKIPLAELGPARLSIGQVGVTDTLHFQQLSELPNKPAKGFVDVEMKAASLNAKDIYCMSGRIETTTGTVLLDFAGVVSAVGPDITHLSPGDRVVVWAPNHFRTTERVPVGCVHKMLPGEEFTVLPALLTVQATVLYALRDRAGLRAGESVLIHGGAGAFGVAAIAYAQRIGAHVYTTVGSKAKEEFLVNTLGVPASHIFNSRDASFVAGIKKATRGRGVNVIVNSLVGSLLHDSWSGCLADFGRFVEIGKRDLIDAGKLDMDVFLRGCTFTAFDLSTLFHAENKRDRDTWNSLMADVLQLYRDGLIQTGPITSFDVGDIAQAYRHFHNRDRVGKLVISLEHPESLVAAAPPMYRTLFDPQKVYLLVGCLGGLGRSLSRWMLARGARSFVFLGRSGCDKPDAQQLVARLRNAGASVTVVRGDIVKGADVQAAVDACVATGLPIGGVVQAAMGLHEALFSRMTNEAWHTGIQPKWRGTWNLQSALEADGRDKNLDFFLLTSSISGTVGTATESNYCSANGFLDAFARWRRTQGKPAVSVGLGMISEVGYLHENPDIEALLLRKGIQPLNEDEFLQVIDIALAGTYDKTSLPEDDPAASHILTGLEAFSVRKLLAQGFDVSNGTIEDPRGAVLSASLQAEQDAKNASAGGLDRTQLDLTASPWLKEVPAAAVSVFAPEGDAPSLLDAVLRLTVKRFSNLILMPRDQLDVDRPLPQFGVDSMLAAEFRTWFWSAFRVDVPFLDMMSAQKSLGSLAEFVEGALVKSWEGSALAKVLM